MGERSPAVVPERASELAVQLRSVLGKLRRRLREQGARDDHTPSQVAVVLRLERDGPATVSDLARAEGMRPQSMSATVASLQADGLLVCSTDPKDGRKMLMSLSKKAERLLREGRAVRQDWLSHTIAQRLSEKEQQKLVATLELLHRIVDE